ncbi:hypothetical protein [Agrococcus sp. Ld7]|uniref:hypothetical protein n=1 Tax=Agrococcus sp. Ld7 TaxID=649148 RepID=UPI003865C7FE
MLSAAQLLWVFVMGLIAGGQFVADDWPEWDPLAPWPVVAVPAWVSIALGVTATVGAIGMAAERVREPRSEGGVVQAFAITIVALIVIPIGLANVYSDPTGVSVPLYWLTDPFGWHWLAAIPQVLTLAALGIRFARVRRAGRRA